MEKYTEFGDTGPRAGDEAKKARLVWQKPEIEIVGMAEITKLKGGSATDGNTTLIS